MWRGRLLIIVLAACFAIPCDASQSAGSKNSHRQSNVTWQFDTRNDRDGNPNTKVLLNVGGRQVFILRDTAQFSVLERKDYSSHGVPSTAVAACFGWWAGSGEEMYVIRRGRQLIVYIRYLDEQTETGRYRRLKVIPLTG